MTAPHDPADDELVRFARMVAHGLRNPLAIATGMLDLLERQIGDQLDDEMRHVVTRTSVALHRAGDLVLSLQRYTAATRAELRPVAVDLVEVARAVAEQIVASEIGTAGARIDVADGLPTVVADREAIERICTALLDNAVRHVEGDVPAQVAVTGGDDGAHWWLEVTDDGPGIPAAQRDDALVPGERLGRTGDGFGLGLAMVDALVHRHAGELHLDDAPGGGLRVQVRLPKEPLLGEQGA